MSKAHILFVDLEMHKGTGSSQFFTNLLRQRFDVDRCYVTSRKDPKMPTKEDVRQYDAVAYWQVTPSNIRAKSYGKPSIYLPMYDAETFNIFNWMQRRISGAKAICFCEKEADFLVRAGFSPLRVKYYPEIRAVASGNPRKLFFWDRIQKLLHATGHASFITLKCLFNPGDLDGMVIRCTKRRSQLVSEEDKEKYNVTILPAEKYLSHEEYFAMFSDCGIFSTSRATEGIGMGFLEAMAMGKCVVVNDNATFNEYVRDGVSGILVDYSNPIASRAKIAKADISAIQKEAYRQSVEGRKIWEQNHVPAIFEFIDNAISEYRPMSFAATLAWWCLVPLKFVRDVRKCVRQKWRILKHRRIQGEFNR